MKLQHLAAVVGLLVALPNAGRAQATATVQLVAPNAPGGSSVVSPDGKYYESPYTALVNGRTTRVNCVDFFHDVVIGEVWQAYDISLADIATNASLLAYTRNGNLANALQIYEQVAWLTNQYAADPAANKPQTIAIQTAIWAIANTQPGTNFLALTPSQTVGSLDTGPANNNQNSTGYWIGKAQGSYAALEGTGYYDQFRILTDVNVNNRACQNNAATKYTCTAQEFMYATPEPGTLVLLGTGFAALVGRVKRRKGRGSDQTVI